VSEQSTLPTNEPSQESGTSPTPEKGIIRGDKGLDTAQVVISAFLIAAAGFIAYIGTWNIPFQGRDLELFVDSAALHRMVTFTEALDAFPNAPLAAMGLAKHYSFFGGSPVALHALNLLLHLMNGILLYLLCRKVLGRGVPEPVAMLAGLLFAVAPYNADAVNFLTGRPYLQAVFFSLGAMLLFLRAVDGEETHYGYVAGAVAAYGLAAGSHFSAIGVPLLLTGLGAIQHTVKKHWPAHLILGGVFSALGTAMLCTTATYARPPAAALYMALAVAPVLLSWAFNLTRHPKIRTVQGIAVAVVLLALCSVTYLRTAACQDPVAWWSAQAEKSPAEPVAWRYLARYLEQQAADRPQEKQGPVLEQSVQAWRHVLALLPEDAAALSHLGLLLHRLGRAEEAVPILKHAVRNNPFDQKATEHLGILLAEAARKSVDVNQLRRAAEYFDRAEQLGALSREGIANYVTVLAGLGDAEGSYARLRPLAGNEPDSTLAPLLKQMETTVNQIQDLNKKSLEQVKSAAPDMDTVLNRGEMQMLRGEMLPASYLLDAVVRKQPENTRAWTLLGVVRARMKQEESFVKEWGGTAADSAVWDDLIRRCAGSGLWDAAKTYITNSPVAPNMMTPALIRLADMAIEVKQPRMAVNFLKEAADANAGDPLPWLKLCDMAIAAKDIVHAHQYLSEAEKRNAAAEDIQSRRKHVGDRPAPPAGPVNTIIQ